MRDEIYLEMASALIYMGDCMQVMPNIESNSIDFICADLPFGVTRNRWDSLIPLDALWREYERIIKPSGVVALNAIQPFASALVFSNPAAFKYDLIWRKTQSTGFLNAKKRPLRSHEHIMIFFWNKPKYNPQFGFGSPCKGKTNGRIHTENYGNQSVIASESDGARYPVSVLDFAPDRIKLHPTQKPVALIDYLIRTFTDSGETVLDNTMGSGATGVACMLSGRKFIGIEFNQQYCDIAISRIGQQSEKLNES